MSCETKILEKGKIVRYSGETSYDGPILFTITYLCKAHNEVDDQPYHGCVVVEGVRASPAASAVGDFRQTGEENL